MALGLVEAGLPLHVVAYLAGSLIDSHGTHLIRLKVAQIKLSRASAHQMLREVLVQTEIYGHVVLVTLLRKPLLHLRVVAVLLVAVLHVFPHLLVRHLLRLDAGAEWQLVALRRSLVHVDRALIHVSVAAHDGALGVWSGEDAGIGLLAAAGHPRVRLYVEVARAVALWHRRCLVEHWHSLVHHQIGRRMLLRDDRLLRRQGLDHAVSRVGALIHHMVAS